MNGIVKNIKERLSEIQMMSRASGHSFLMKLLEQHHKETYWHSLRVASLCLTLSDALRIEPKKKEMLVKSALLHDVGKLMIDKQILNKQDKLTEYEWKVMKKHCGYGVKVIHKYNLDATVDLDVIRYHHENLDGTGYAELKDRELSMSVKIIRVADSFDAMTGPRVYRSPLNVQESFDELYRWSGIHYEPQVVDTLNDLHNGAHLEGIK